MSHKFLKLGVVNELKSILESDLLGLYPCEPVFSYFKFL